MKKALFGIFCALILALPAFAGTVVQGNNNFTYSDEMATAINSEGTFTVVDGSSYTVKDVDALFLERLSGIAFTVPYVTESKPAVLPGYLNITFTESAIAAYPNGASILSEINNSPDPLSVVFKYFDPILLVYGPDGDLTSVNVKNSVIPFTFVRVDANTMAVTANIVLGDGYPQTGFFIEMVGGYICIYDAIVSEGSQSKTGDGNIEFAFALVPNDNTQETVSDYPVVEIDGDNGYVTFNDPSSHLNIPELQNFSAAKILAGSTVFSTVDNGISFSTSYDNSSGAGATYVTASVYLDPAKTESLGEDFSLSVNGYGLSPAITELPDGGAFASVSFLLVDGEFTSDVFVSDGTVVFFDGNEDGKLEASAVAVAGEAAGISPVSVMETTTNGYVFFDDPSEYLSVPEVSAKNVAPAGIVSGTASFTVFADGYSFNVPYSGTQVGSSYVRAFLRVSKDRMDELLKNPVDILLKIGNDTFITPNISSLPDGSSLLSAEFLLVDDAFTVEAFYSDAVLVVFDGSHDNVLSASLQVATGSYGTGLFTTIIEDTENGYVMFEDPSSFFSIPEISIKNPVVAQISSTTFTALEDGYTMESQYDNSGVGAIYTTVTVTLSPERLRELGIKGPEQVALKIGNSFISSPSVVEQPDGSYYVSVRVLLVDDSFASEIITSDGMTIFFDGENDGVLTLSVQALKKESAEFPVMESTTNGYVLFTDPSALLNIAEVSGAGAVPAVISKGATIFVVTDNGYSFETNYKNYPKETGAVFVSASVRIPVNKLEELGIGKTDQVMVEINGYRVAPTSVLELSDGSYLVTVEYLLVDGQLAPGVLSSNETLVVFDGERNGKLESSISVVAAETSEETPSVITYHHSHGAFEIKTGSTLPEGLLSVEPVSGSFTQAVLPLLDGFGGQISPVKLEISYTGVKDNSAISGNMEFTVYKSDLSAGIISKLEGSIESAMEYLRPVIAMGDIFFDVYEYLKLNGAGSLLSVSGSLDTGITISIPCIIVDSDRSRVSISSDKSSLIIYDGNLDGKMIVKSYIGIVEPTEEKPEGAVIFESPTLYLKSISMNPANYNVDLIEDIDIEDTGYADWSGREDVLGAVCVGSFSGEYDDSKFSRPGYISSKVTISVTAAELKNINKDRYEKMKSDWIGGKKVNFLGYYHIYKQIDGEIYDLNLIGGKDVFAVSGDPTQKITISFPAVIIDGEDITPVVFDEDLSCFVIYDGEEDGKIVDPLFVGAPKKIDIETGEGETGEEPEEGTKGILPDVPEGPSTGHSDIGKWMKIFSLF